MTLTSGGNLGLGVTPSAWGGGMKAYQVGRASLAGLSNTAYLLNNAYYDGSGYKYIDTDYANLYSQNNTAGQHAWWTAPSGTAGNAISFTQAMTLDASGRLGIGETSPTQQVHAKTASTTYYLAETTGTGASSGFRMKAGASADYTLFTTQGGNQFAIYDNAAGIQRVTLDSSGNLLVGTTSTSTTTTGIRLLGSLGIGEFTSSSDLLLTLNRLNNDGVLISFRQDNTEEGNISVSGTTVSYNGGHLSRWAQTTTAKDESLVKGTVLSNLDAMNVYTDAEGNPIANEQLNKVKVSDTEGDVNVAGVFVNWTHDEQHNVDEINMAMTGDMIIRIAQGVTVVRGDLLMSAGDGTAKPQGDDIVRSKTVAKVTSNHITCTYADGSYCVPCVLMAC